ncbi:hypothetical protein B0H19DRAFT_132857 [Mycena capillaripes]|nr:hypothetical protein B0H19DRAFT_132857 [Mycena capillaripes]
MARLPFEISSEIFLECLPPLPELSAHNVPMLLLNVCTSWTDIAASIPDLWTNVNIIFSRAEGLKEGLQAWLQCAVDRLLSISLRGPTPFDEGILCIIWRHGQQLKHLELCCETVEDENSDEDASDECKIQFFGGLSPGPLPLLQTLTIRGSTKLHHWKGYFGPEILELMRLAPNLVECSFPGVLSVYDTYSEPDGTLVHPALRRLIFGEHGEHPDSNDEILNCLSLPALDSLSLSRRIVSGDDLFAFLKRSSPPLKELILGGGRDSGQLHRCLSLVPSLVRFEMWCLQADSLAGLFAALAGSSFPMIPNLRSLTIQGCAPAIPNSTWKTLAGRRTELHIVHIEMRPGAVNSITSDILAGFGELVADGMQLFIGTTERNFLSG